MKRSALTSLYEAQSEGGLAESIRLAEDSHRERNWKRWGPYLPERQWGTVREDYSTNGNSWDYFPHDHARSRVYRWGEDGLFGWCDRECRLCFAPALWNGKDPILKERLFGLTNSEGNHGEDVKECYFYLDATPTHSYQKALYKYPQAEFPYARLVAENRNRGPQDPEFELLDTGIFDEDRYFDVFVEYAKGGPNDTLIRITAFNRGPEPATLHVLPTLWFRNVWSWGRTDEDYQTQLRISRLNFNTLEAKHSSLGRILLVAGPSPSGDNPVFLFTENETNSARLFGIPNPSPFVKDAFHEYVIRGRHDLVRDEGWGTKAAVHYHGEVPPGAEFRVGLRLYSEDEAPTQPLARLSTRSSIFVFVKPTSSMQTSSPTRVRVRASHARPMPACFGLSSSTNTSFLTGWPAISSSLRRLQNPTNVATVDGSTCTAATCFLFPISGNSRGLPHGTRLFIW